MSKYIKHSMVVETIQISRIVPIHHGEFCSSRCAYDDGHPSAWRTVTKGSPAKVLDGLVDKLLKGPLRQIDVTGYDARRQHYVTIDGGYNMETEEEVENWVESLRMAISRNYRLRLYGDDHGWGDNPPPHRVVTA